METNFFENTQYKNKFTRKSLLLEIGLTDTTDYTVTLPEELKIDNFSEVFVDTVVTNNIEINSVSAPHNLGMLLKIDGINTRTIGGDTTGINNNYNEGSLTKEIVERLQQKAQFAKYKVLN